jgi:hypothetical protein
MRASSVFWLRRILVVFTVLGARTACSSDSGDSESSSNDGADPTDGTTEDETDESAIPEWSGDPLNPFDLRSGQCFNEVSWIDEVQERRINITAAIDCAQPHDKEVYFEAEFPAPNGAPFPGDVKMGEWSTEVCYDAFSDFVGEEYELSKYGIDYLQPTKDTFEHPVGRHRRVTCFLYDTGGEQLTSTARGSAV